MKFHWGHGIAAAAFLFVCFICALVYRSMQEKVDFVTTGYYEKELTYQDHIDSEKNALALTENLKLVYQAASEEVILRYPADLPYADLSGEISFYRPDNSDLDFKVPVKSDDSHSQKVSTSAMKKGLWKVMINWKNGSTPYYLEEKIFVN